MTYCSQARILELVNRCRETGTASIERNGTPVSKRAQMRILRDAQRMGQVWFPACANMDRTGRCQGHEEGVG